MAEKKAIEGTYIRFQDLGENSNEKMTPLEEALDDAIYDVVNTFACTDQEILSAIFTVLANRTFAAGRVGPFIGFVKEFAEAMEASMEDIDGRNI